MMPSEAGQVRAWDFYSYGEANVPGKRGIFTRMVDAALERPDDTVRDAVYPGVVPAG